MSQNWYTEVFCANCSNFVAWISESGPRGSIIRTACYELEEDEED